MALIWGVNFPIIKASLAAISPLAFNALRFPLASLTVLIILRAGGPLPRPARTDWTRIFLLGVVGNVVYQGFFIFGLNATYAGNASILLATIPVWTLILSTVRHHERPGLQVWAGIGITVLGMILVVLGGGQKVGFRGTPVVGDVLMVGAALAWSAYTVGSRGMVKKYGPVPVTAWTLWIGSPALVVLGIPSLLLMSPGTVPVGAWLGVSFAGIFAIGLAYILWYGGVHRIGSSRTAAYQNLVPIIALGLAWAWLGEVPEPIQLAGAAVILAGVSLARFGKERVAASP
jgi:drug/metabolite transporter (DMT)-like permease